jgi:hypothetical protein
MSVAASAYVDVSLRQCERCLSADGRAVAEGLGVIARLNVCLSLCTSAPLCALSVDSGEAESPQRRQTSGIG